jgi:hypothetical protein
VSWFGKNDGGELEGRDVHKRGTGRTVSARGGVVFTRLVGRNWGYEVIGTWKIVFPVI